MGSEAGGSHPRTDCRQWPGSAQSKLDCLAAWEDGLDSDRSLLYEADAVIVRLFKIDAQDIGQARRLKVISRHGAGLDNIDLQAATAAGWSTPLAERSLTKSPWSRRLAGRSGSNP